MSTLIACCISAVVISTAVSLAVHGPLLLLVFLDEREWSQRGGRQSAHATFNLPSEIPLGWGQMSGEMFQQLLCEAVDNMSPDELSHVTNVLLGLERDQPTVSGLSDEAPINR